MKIYIHKGKGHYIGSAVVLITKDRESAEKFIREELDAAGLKDEPLDITEHKIEPGFIYFNNGDY